MFKGTLCKCYSDLQTQAELFHPYSTVFPMTRELNNLMVTVFKSAGTPMLIDVPNAGI